MVKKRNRPSKKDVWEKPQGSRWDTPKQEYILSPKPIGIVDLAKKWSGAWQTFASYSRKEDWVKEREKNQKYIEDLLKERTAEAKVEKTVKFKDILEQRWYRVIQRIDEILLAEEIADVDGKKKKVPVKLKAGQLTEITSSLQKCQDKLSEVIGVDLAKIVEEKEDKHYTIVFGYGEKDTYRSKV